MAKTLQLINGVPRSVDTAVADLYDATYVVGGGGITTGTSITLPNSETYSDEELFVHLNNILQETVLDYNYVGGSPPRTQIQFTFDLIEGDRLRFKKILS